MKKRSKALLTLACAACLVVGSVMGTLAYLTSTDSVKNTFTVGDVKITLDEAPVGEDGDAIAGDRVKANEYHLLPGHKYHKDPTIHVAEGSEDCWLFVKVTNAIEEIEGPTDTIAEQMAAEGWTLVDGETNIYAYNRTVSEKENILVFSSFIIDGDVENDEIAGYVTETDDEGNVTADATKIIEVVAYAIQADGFDTAADAWTNAGAQAQKK